MSQTQEKDLSNLDVLIEKANDNPENILDVIIWLCIKFNTPEQHILDVICFKLKVFELIEKYYNNMGKTAENIMNVVHIFNKYWKSRNNVSIVYNVLKRLYILRMIF